MTSKEGLAKMTALAAGQTTATLCESLVTLDRKTRLDEAERLTRAVLIDVLCGRHPEADAAFGAWADGPEPGGAIEAIVAAARKAGQS